MKMWCGCCSKSWRWNTTTTTTISSSTSQWASSTHWPARWTAARNALRATSAPYRLQPTFITYFYYWSTGKLVLSSLFHWPFSWYTGKALFTIMTVMWLRLRRCCDCDTTATTVQRAVTATNLLSVAQWPHHFVIFLFTDVDSVHHSSSITYEIDVLK